MKNRYQLRNALFFSNLETRKYFTMLLFIIVGINQSFSGQTGPNDDFDGDGIVNSADLDDDNDGILDCAERGFTAVASVDDIFKLNGSAAEINAKQIRLTQAAGDQSGQAWSNGKVDFAKSFVISYEANLGTKDEGADGIATVFHNSPAGVNAGGAVGIGIGAAGIANGIVLEIDTYDNQIGVGDIANDHGQIWVSSNQAGQGLLTTAIDLGNLEDGVWRKVIVRWDFPTKTLSYTVGGVTAGSFTFPANKPITSYFNNVSKVYFGYTASTGGANNEQSIRFVDFCSELPLELDTDNDGINDQFDVDSDNDGCPDAIEGSENVTADQIYPLTLPTTDPNYAFRGQIKVIYNGVSANTPANIVSQSPAALGVPQLVNNAGNNLNNVTNPTNLAGVADNTDVPEPKNADIGQRIGDSKNALIRGCICYNNPNTTGAGTPTLHGITLLQRANSGAAAWPGIRTGAFTALESNTKGFVITRMTTLQVNAISSPQQGMMVYDTNLSCLKIYDGTAWSCFNTPACP